MAQPLEYRHAPPEVRLVYDGILETRRKDWINNFWKVIAHHPTTLKRVWADIKDVMVRPYRARFTLPCTAPSATAQLMRSSMPSS